jgi:hypothetical protein
MENKIYQELFKFLDYSTNQMKKPRNKKKLLKIFFKKSMKNQIFGSLAN